MLYSKDDYKGRFNLLLSELALIKVALRRHPKRFQQAHALGISERALFDKLKRHQKFL